MDKYTHICQNYISEYRNDCLTESDKNKHLICNLLKTLVINCEKFKEQKYQTRK